MVFPESRSTKRQDTGIKVSEGCRPAGFTDISLHSYRYAWAQRAKSLRDANARSHGAPGPRSKAIHHAYSDKAEIVSLPLEFYEKQWKEKIIQFTKAATG